MRKVYYLGLLLLLISAASVKAQVTIGKDSIPHGGALLDLQQPNATTKKGLKVPIVFLSDVGLYGLTSGDQNTATGMVVYNNNPSIGVGLYVWDGNKWNLLGDSRSRSSCPSTVKDLENNSYAASSFGSAGCWMTENLRSTQNDVMPAGTINVMDAPNIKWDADYNVKVATYPNKDATNKSKMGMLYTWGAATNRVNISANEACTTSRTDPTPQTQGICPSGWHLPSDKEWSDLEKVIAASGAGVYSDSIDSPWNDDYYILEEYRPASGSGHGSKMKSKNQVSSTYATAGVSKAASAGGFDGLLVGHVKDSGNVAGFGTHTYYWSSSSCGGISAWYRYLGYSRASMSRGIYYKSGILWSVRCKKN